MKNMVEKPCSHFISDFLAWCQQGKTQNGSLAVFIITQAFMHKVLNFQHVSTSYVGSADKQDFDEFSNRVLDDLQSLECSFTLILLSHEK